MESSKVGLGAEMEILRREHVSQERDLLDNDDAYSSTGTGLERTGSLGWTEEAGGQDWRMPNCLWRDRITAC